jgi:uncharacterized protein YndB with AHSA1/START domain
VTETQRSIDISVEVPGTPEEVWDTIATSDGMRSWFMAIPVDPDDDTVKVWEPPHRFVTEKDTGPGGAPLAYEWLVEAQSGGTCIVRLVNSGFGAGDDWDAEYDNMTAGWAMFFQNLRLQLTHFRGQRAALLEAVAMVQAPMDAAWKALGDGIAGDAPFTGTVEWADDYSEVLLLEKPMPGTAVAVAVDLGEQAMVAVSLYLYGDTSEAAQSGEKLQAWLAARFPDAS